MSTTATNKKLEIIKDFYARASGSFDYILAILRVGGINYYPEWNEFEVDLWIEKRINEKLEKYPWFNKLSKPWVVKELCHYLEISSFCEPYHVLINLLRISQKQSYSLVPLQEESSNWIEAVLNLAVSDDDKAKLKDLFSCLNQELVSKLEVDCIIQQGDILVDSSTHEAIITHEEFIKLYEEAKQFFDVCIKVLKGARLEWVDHPWKEKLIGHYSEVLHLFVDEKVGLYGFEIKKPNNPSSKFVRTKEKVDGNNYMFDKEGRVEFIVGDIDEYKKHPTLHAMKHPDSTRYNKLGEWQALESDVDSKSIQEEINKLTNDEIVKGCLFYIKATGYKAIEFAVKGKVQICKKKEEIELPDGIKLYRCPKRIISPSNEEVNLEVYDGTMLLLDDNPQTIKSALETIDLTIKSLSIYFDSALTWRIKSQINSSQSGCLVANEKDLENYVSVIHQKISKGLQLSISTAIEWYTRGITSKNECVAFSCFCFAVDNLATEISEGTFVNLGFNKFEKSEKELESQAKNELEEFYKKGEIENCLEFVRQLAENFKWFVTQKVKHGVSEIFGKDSKIVKRLFEEKYNGKTVWGMRSDMAHGRKKKLPRVQGEEKINFTSMMREISREFILRILLGIKSDEKLPQISNTFSSGYSMYDPRSCFVRSGPSFLPKDVNWEIRAEWID